MLEEKERPRPALIVEQPLFSTNAPTASADTKIDNGGYDGSTPTVELSELEEYRLREEIKQQLELELKEAIQKKMLEEVQSTFKAPGD